MKKFLYILLLLPCAVIAQKVPAVNGYKTFLDKKQVDITHYFIDPDNVSDICTDKNAKEVYITRKEQVALTCLADLRKEAKTEGKTIVITVNSNVIENPESYYIENSAVTGVAVDKSTEVASINITTKNSRKE